MVSKHSSINDAKNQAVDFYQSSTAGAYLVLSLGLTYHPHYLKLKS